MRGKPAGSTGLPEGGMEGRYAGQQCQFAEIERKYVTVPLNCERAVLRLGIGSFLHSEEC